MRLALDACARTPTGKAAAAPELPSAVGPIPAGDRDRSQPQFTRSPRRRAGRRT